LGNLTDNQFDIIAGKLDCIDGKTQEAIGLSMKQAGKQLSDWQKK
jgi:uncharacterized protein YjbJ (UPF0337 family)